MPTGWDAAVGWRKLQQALPPGLVRRTVEERAVDAILDHARRLLRHAARPRRLDAVAWPGEGELDLEETIERPRPWAPGDVRLLRQVPREADVVAILDMSLSMTGEKTALVAVATAILRLKLENVAVVAFDTGARVLVRVGEVVSPRELVRRVLTVPAQGYTNIEGGLVAAADQLRRSGRRERVGLLLTDGIANVGGDPVSAAGRLPRPPIVYLGDHP
ncbi:MAG: vWA domain-containing protein, partial [Myxococcota bacterium]